MLFPLQYYNLGTKLKDEAPDAVRSGKCGRSCTCNQIQVNLGWEHWTNNYTGAKSFKNPFLFRWLNNIGLVRQVCFSVKLHFQLLNLQKG